MVKTVPLHTLALFWNHTVGLSLIHVQITYGFGPTPVMGPLSPVAEKTMTYGFVPPDLELRKPSASAFWPEVLSCSAGHNNWWNTSLPTAVTAH